MARILSLAAAIAVLAAFMPPAAAEPYLAVYKGLQCSACHTHQAGGGKRNPYGNAFAQTKMPAQTLGNGEVWSGDLGRWFVIGRCRTCSRV